MKYLRCIAVFSLCILFLFAAFAQAQTRQVNWEAFSVNLVKAIESGHPGLQQSAMQRIIQYADYLNVDEAIYEIGQIFRFNENSKIRRLAMVALFKINNDEALQVLARYMPLEEDSSIKNQGCCILNLYMAEKKAEKEKELVVETY